MTKERNVNLNHDGHITSAGRRLDEPDNYLATQKNSWADQIRATGRTVTYLEPPTDTGKYIVSFVPREGAPRINAKVQIIPAEPCLSCGTILETDGRCRACCGDVMGLCDFCNGILDDGFLCPTCVGIKPVFARLKPEMTREQKVRNLIAALEKSGLTVHPVKTPTDKEGSA